MYKKGFRHNDVDSFIDILTDVRNSQPQIRSGNRSVIIAIEGFYSMDGDVCPLAELIQAAKEIFPEGQAQFIIDEAHSSGIVGPNGAGLVSALGLEKEIAVRMHTFGKALSSAGGVILCNETVKKMLINQAKTVICSIAPSFTLLAGARAGYDLLKTEYAAQARQRLQHNTKFFLEELHSNPIWEEASDAGILRMPVYEEEGWDSRPFVTHICPVWTPRPKNNIWLSFHLQLAGYAAYPVFFPIVPKQQERVRIIIHAGNTEEEIRGLVASICAFGEEMLEIEESGDKNRVPSAARYANGLYAKEEMNIHNGASTP
jgi:8-amino-7-oxononanoate synthase